MKFIHDVQFFSWWYLVSYHFLSVLRYTVKSKGFLEGFNKGFLSRACGEEWVLKDSSREPYFSKSWEENRSYSNLNIRYISMDKYGSGNLYLNLYLYLYFIFIYICVCVCVCVVMWFMKGTWLWFSSMVSSIMHCNVHFLNPWFVGLFSRPFAPN
jgi:hypothetical protein